MVHATEPAQAELKSVSLAGLLAGNGDAVHDLLSSCQENGFFYLDLRHPLTNSTLNLVDDLVNVGNLLFKRPLEEKEEFSTEKHLPSRLLGYKRVGCSVGPIADKRDGYESFSIHNNGVFGDDALTVPQDIKDNMELVTAFMANAHAYTDCILSILSEALELPYNLKDSHRKDKPSSANMAMLRYLTYGSSDTNIGNVAHTDMGTLTVVFSQVSGLQVMLPGSEEWKCIEPRAGHAVVNVGDSLHFLSGGALPSCLHRVVPPPNSAGQDKFSVIYFLRPEFDAKFTAYGRQMNSIEWHNQKYALFREAALDPTKSGAMLTGREGYIGLPTV